MNSMHLEILVEALPGTERSVIQDWLTGHGLEPLPMKVGFLVAAELNSLRKAVPALTGTEPGEVPIPEEMKNHVHSIRIFKPRSLHSS